jgi:hypothetical protein
VFDPRWGYSALGGEQRLTQLAPRSSDHPGPLRPIHPPTASASDRFQSRSTHTPSLGALPKETAPLMTITTPEHRVLVASKADSGGVEWGRGNQRWSRRPVLVVQEECALCFAVTSSLAHHHSVPLLLRGVDGHQLAPGSDGGGGSMFTSYLLSPSDDHKAYAQILSRSDHAHSTDECYQRLLVLANC